MDKQIGEVTKGPAEPQVCPHQYLWAVEHLRLLAL